MTEGTATVQRTHMTPAAGCGPLVVSTRNPRYFTHRDDPTGRAVYLTGSHIWNNLQDGMGPGADAPRRAGALRLRCLPPVPDRARPQLHPSLAMGAVPITGGRRQLPPRHVAPGPGPAPDRARRRTASRGSTSSGSTTPSSRGYADGWSPPARPGSTSACCCSTGGRSTSARRPTTSRATRSTPGTTSTRSAPGRSTISRSCRSTRRSGAIQEAFITKVVDTLHDLPNVLWEVANDPPATAS